MKILNYFFLLCFFASSLAAQNKQPVFRHSEYANVDEFIIKHFVFDKQEARKLCNNGLAFAKFRVSPSGQIIDLAYSNEMPTFIKNTFQQAILASEEFWEAAQEESDYLVLPYRFFFQAGCEQEGDIDIKTHISLHQLDEEAIKNITFDDDSVLGNQKIEILSLQEAYIRFMGCSRIK